MTIIIDCMDCEGGDQFKLSNEELDGYNLVNLAIISEKSSLMRTMTVSVKELAAALKAFDALRDKIEV